MENTQKNVKRALTKEDSESVILWAESPEEARSFIDQYSGYENFPAISKVFTAKRSPKSRTGKYVGGDYYRTSNDKIVDVYEDIVTAPDRITDLVQWCTCDIMISIGDTPIFVFEDTTHIVRMNLYQRIPRLARAAHLGVPSLVLQGTRGLDFDKRGDRWALYRYLQVFHSLSKIYPLAPPMPFYYVPTDDGFRKATDQCANYMVAILNNDTNKILKTRETVILDLQVSMTDGIGGDIARDIPSINYSGNDVIIKIGAKPDKKSWMEKGSGQMDPYLGLIAAAKFIYCYNEEGRKIKNCVVEFTYIPKDFYFFKNHHESKSLYKRLAFEIADEVRFLG